MHVKQKNTNKHKKDPFIQGGSNLYHILRTNSVTRVLLCQSRNDEVYHRRERCLWLYVRPYLDEQCSRALDPQGHMARQSYLN